MFHANFLLALITLILGVALLILIKNQNKVKTAWAYFTGWFVIALSLLCLIHSAVRIITYWNCDHYKMRYKMMHFQNPQNKDHMMNGMKNNMNRDDMKHNKDMMRKSHNMKKHEKDEDRSMKNY